MKTKYLLAILGIMFLLLAYNVFCYSLVNHVIKDRSKLIVENYFSEMAQSTEYDYKMATYDYEANTIHIYIAHTYENEEKLYCFVVTQNGNLFQLVDVNNNIPAYIR